jgi:hypothetical protein
VCAFTKGSGSTTTWVEVAVAPNTASSVAAGAKAYSQTMTW